MHFRKHAYVITVDILFLTVIIILMVDGWGLAWVRPPMVQYQIKTHGSVSCGPRSRRVTPLSILTGRKKTQFSHLRSPVLP